MICGHSYEPMAQAGPSKIPGCIIHIEIGSEIYPGTQTHRCLLNKYIFSIYDVYKLTEPAASIFASSLVVIGPTMGLCSSSGCRYRAPRFPTIDDYNLESLQIFLTVDIANLIQSLAVSLEMLVGKDAAAFSLL